MISDLQAFERLNSEINDQDEEEKKDQDSPNIDHFLSNSNSIMGLGSPLIVGKTNLIVLGKHERLLRKWFNGKLLQLKLLYRGSDH